MKRPRTLTREEAAAWARVARGVKAIGAVAQAPEPDDAVPMIDARPKLAKRTAAPAPIVEKKATHVPANRGPEKRVRRGQVDISARFDLHGHTQASAARALPAFLARAAADGTRTALVITGKGRDGEGVLKRQFRMWLETPDAHALVSAYAQAHPSHGGAGAFYVFLRRAKNTTD